MNKFIARALSVIPSSSKVKSALEWVLIPKELGNRSAGLVPGTKIDVKYFNGAYAYCGKNVVAGGPDEETFISTRTDGRKESEVQSNAFTNVESFNRVATKLGLPKVTPAFFKKMMD